MYIGLHTKSDFIFEKYSNITFYENPSSGNRVCSMQTDVTKLVVAFHNFANAPRTQQWCVFAWAHRLRPSVKAL